jgi:hypothetical protein
MSFIENLIQPALSTVLNDEYVTYYVYLPSKTVKADFSNANINLGTAIGSFQGSAPKQKPSSVADVIQTGDAIILSSQYSIDIISLPFAVVRKHIIQATGGDLYEPVVDLSDDLIGRNVSLLIKKV